MGKLDTVSLKLFRKFLLSQGLEMRGTSGGHEIWLKPGMLRPVVIQTHVDPVPIGHIATNLASMHVDKVKLMEFLGSKKQQKTLKK
jgi:hypothetical protein